MVLEDYSILSLFYDIKTPFLMDGEAEKLKEKFSEKEEESFNINKKRIYEDYFIKKNKKVKGSDVLSSEELETLAEIKRKFLEIQNSQEYESYFKFLPSLKDIGENNKASRIARNMFVNAVDKDMHLHDITGVNQAPEPAIHELFGHKYLIPSRSRYINGDVLQLDSHLLKEKFDLVVMDPPWWNKHVRRRKKAKGLSERANFQKIFLSIKERRKYYKMMNVEDIMKIPLKTILSPDAFVLIWITNSSKILKEFLQSLKLWDLEIVTTWYWLKITKTGEPVSSLDAPSRGKLPYEKLLVSRRINSNREFPGGLENLVFCSIPCSVHSHKPPLNDLLKETLNVNEDWKCLELFARSLIQNWTSVGNEVLKFQDLGLLQPLEECD